MGNILKEELLLSAEIGFKSNAIVADEVDTEITKAPSGETVRLYVTFNKSEGEALSAKDKAEALKESLPANAEFEIRRIDDEGYAAVIKTVDTNIDLIKKNDSVADVIIEEEAHTTEEDEIIKKNETEGFEGSKTEEVIDTVDESITVNTNENELGNLETIAVMDVAPEPADNGVRGKGGISVLLPTALMVIIVVSVLLHRLLKKKK